MNKKTLKLPFCDLEFYDNYVIGVIKDGAVITQKEVRLFNGATDLFFKKNPFVYISKRVNSYSVNPIIYNNLYINKNMIGLAVVSTNNFQINNAEIEKLFFERPFVVFNVMEEAKDWALNLLNSHNKD